MKLKTILDFLRGAAITAAFASAAVIMAMATSTPVSAAEVDQSAEQHA